jgi:hypothetical protein
MAGVGETVVLADAVAVGAVVSAAGRAVFANASANKAKQRLSFMVGQGSVRFARRQPNREWILFAPPLALYGVRRKNGVAKEDRLRIRYRRLLLLRLEDSLRSTKFGLRLGSF